MCEVVEVVNEARRACVVHERRCAEEARDDHEGEEAPLHVPLAAGAVPHVRNRAAQPWLPLLRVRKALSVQLGVPQLLRRRRVRVVEVLLLVVGRRVVVVVVGTVVGGVGKVVRG